MGEIVRGRDLVMPFTERVLMNELERACDKLGIDGSSLEGVDVLLLPENIDSSGEELLDADDSIILAKEMKAAGLACKTGYDVGLRPSVMDRRAVDVWCGVVWVLSNVATPAVAGFLSTWLANRFLQQQSNKATPQVHLDLRVQNGERLTKLDYVGPPEDLVALLSGLKKLNERSD